MKRLRFKKPFEGLTQTLQLIPESYRVNGKTFEMTDGNDSYRIKWNNNRPTIIETEEKNTVDRLTSLMEYDSKKTLGNVIGEGRINENDVFRKILKEEFRLSEFEEELEEPMPEPSSDPMGLGMGPGNGMQDGSGPGDGQGMGMEPQGLGGVEHGMDPMPMEMDTTQIKNAAFEILKGVLDPEADAELMTAINVSQGTENMSGELDGASNEFGDEMMGPDSVDGVPVGDEYSDVMIDLDDYGQTEYDVDNLDPIDTMDELSEVNVDEEGFVDEGAITDFFGKKKVEPEKQNKAQLASDLLKSDPSVAQYAVRDACESVGMAMPPIRDMDESFFVKLFHLLRNSNNRGVNDKNLINTLTQN